MPASRTTFETLAFTENRIAARVTYTYPRRELAILTGVTLAFMRDAGVEQCRLTRPGPPALW
jgi:hypothetical protein